MNEKGRRMKRGGLDFHQNQRKAGKGRLVSEVLRGIHGIAGEGY